MAKAWVGLSEAAKILGAHPATVRNWADRGELPSQRTPGGHRRFRRTDLAQWMAQQGTPGTTEAHILVQSAMGRARLEIGGGHMAQSEWYQRLDEKARAAMSLHGRHLMDALQQYLAAPGIADASSQPLIRARQVGLDYGQTIREQHMSLAEAAEGFFTFNDFILDSMLQMAEISRSGIGQSQSEAIRKIYAFTRTVIVALIDAYQQT